MAGFRDVRKFGFKVSGFPWRALMVTCLCALLTVGILVEPL